MNSGTCDLLEQHFDTAFAARDGIKKLRELILTLAMQGKLVPQDPSDPPASELLKAIEAEKSRRWRDGEIKAPKPLTEIKPGEVPYDLPRGWEWSRIADLTQVLNGRAYSKEELLSSGTPVLRVGNLFTSNHWYYSDLELEPDKYCDVGDLIFSWSASFGPFVWQGPKVIYHYHIWKLALFDDTSLAKEFLYKFLLEKTEEIKAAGHGVSMVHMTKEKMEKIPVPIPPLPEQRRIVAKIDQLMARCDELERLRAEREQKRRSVHTTALKQLLDAPAADSIADAWQFISRHFGDLYAVKENVAELRKAVLQLAVMGKLVPQNPNDPPASQLLKEIEAEKRRLVKEGRIKTQKLLGGIAVNEKGFELPDGWAWARFTDFALDVSTGPFGSLIHQSDYVSGGVPLVNPSHMIDGRIVPDHSISLSKETANNLDSYRLNNGDIVMARRGEVGRVAVVTKVEDGWLCGTGSFVLRFTQQVSRAFVCTLFRCASVRSYLAGAAVGTTMVNLNHGILLKMPIAIPPLPEQRRIVAKIDQIMSLCDTLEQQIDAAASKQAGLLDALMAPV